MTKFITISTDKDDLFLINVAHIVLLKKENKGATLLLSDLREIKTQTNFEEIIRELEN
jgi:hypothetical protein